MKQFNLRLERFFPAAWTHFNNIDWLPFLYALKLAGYDWHDKRDIGKILAFMEREKLIERDGMMVRLAPP